MVNPGTSQGATGRLREILGQVRAALAARMDRWLPDEQSFASPLRSPVLTARLGWALAATFGTCFLTGLFSHVLQHPLPAPWRPPTAPPWLYRLTQGIHVTTGIATIPLLAVKLWSVAPKFWRRPLIGGLADGLERVSILVLVASAWFQLVTGLLNVAEFYAWRFFFTTTHFAVAFVAIGSILLHIAMKLPVIRAAMNVPVQPRVRKPGDLTAGLSRRGVLGLAAGGAGLAALTTVGDKVPVLSPLSVFAQRSGRGPQHLPVNHTAASVGITPEKVDDRWRLEVAGPARTVRLSRADLAALPQRLARLPMACVEGWSVSADWEGVPVRDLLALVGQPPGAVRVASLDRGLYGASEAVTAAVADPDLLVALRLNGEDLHPDHGYPTRLIGPNRPGVLQTKWLTRIEVR